MALYFGALVYAFSGDSSAAVTHADRALRLSPFDPLSYLAHEAYGMAAVGQSRLDEAASHFGRAAQGNTGLGIIDLYHAAVLALAGRVEEARPVARRGLELMPGRNGAGGRGQVQRRRTPAAIARIVWWV